MRIAGLAGLVMAKLGVVPQQIPGGDIYPALERGTIDAAEWVGPYDDEKLGFAKVAPFYYYPGLLEGGPTSTSCSTAPRSRSCRRTTGDRRGGRGLRQDRHAGQVRRHNPAALRRLVGAGTQLRPFPQEVLEAAYKAANEVYDEMLGEEPGTSRGVRERRAFRNEEYLWFQVAEYTCRQLHDPRPRSRVDRLRLSDRHRR